MSIWSEYVDQQLRDAEEQQLLRRLRTVERRDGVRAVLDGREIVSYASNDYLGLSFHPAVVEAATQALSRDGWGAGASRLLGGTLAVHRELEEAVASWKGTEAALVYGSGYLANIGLLPALVGRSDVVYSDKLNHASLVDAAVLSRAAHRRYRHRDVGHARELCAQEAASGRKVVVTETVFSMDGDVAPVAALATLCEDVGALLIVDEAHGTGVFGPTGAGVVEACGLAGSVDVQMGTLSKALGGIGAYVAGEQRLIDFLVNRSRSFIYTTAPPAPVAAAALAAIRIVQQEPERRARLWEHTTYVQGALRDAGLALADTESPIVPVMVGDAEHAMTLSRRLFEEGLYVPGIRPPTVPQGLARLRVTVSSEHRREDLDRLIDVLTREYRALRIPQRAPDLARRRAANA